MQIHQDELQLFLSPRGQDIVFHFFLGKSAVFHHFYHVFSRQVLGNLVFLVCFLGCKLKHFHNEVAFIAVWYPAFQKFSQFTGLDIHTLKNLKSLVILLPQQLSTHVFRHILSQKIFKLFQVYIV